MKKILIALPVIFCIILSVCVPVSSAAVYDVSELNFYSLEDFQKDYPLEEYDRYFYFYGQSDTSYTNTFSFYAPFNEQEATIEESADFIKITFSDEQSLVRNVYSYGSFESSYYHFSYYSIVYYPDSESIYFYDRFNNLVFSYDSTLARPLGLETNLKQGSSLPDVTIRFQPTLKGDVSRDIIVDGQKIGLLDSLKFSITNNSKFPVQYMIRIRPALDSSDPYYDMFGNFDTFIYMKNDYIYDIIGHNSAEEDFNIQDISLYLKPTYFHYLPAKTNEEVSIPFSMINLKEGTTYYVAVQAWRNDYLYSSSNLVDCEFEGFPPNPLYYEIDSNITSVCYSENFKMLQYSDVKYDHGLSSGGVLPYQDKNDYKHYEYMYDAKTDMDSGELIVGHKDLYNDPNSWLNKKPVSPSYTVDGDEISSDVFSNSFSQVFGFVSMFLSWLPSYITTLFIFGFSSIVIIAIIKAVK